MILGLSASAFSSSPKYASFCARYKSSQMFVSTNNSFWMVVAISLLYDGCPYAMHH